MGTWRYVVSLDVHGESGKQSWELRELYPADEGLTLAAADWEVPDELGKAIEDAAKIICVCGSTRFRVEMADANRKLTLAGAIVVAPALYQHDGNAITPDQKRALDELHLKKIDLADAIFVVDPGGYIGESTSREIAYAESMDRPVVRLSSVL